MKINYFSKSFLLTKKNMFSLKELKEAVRKSIANKKEKILIMKTFDLIKIIGILNNNNKYPKQ